MNKINKNNYEAFLLDYLDGKLSESQIKGLEEFLTENPKIKSEFESFEDIKLKAEPVKYEYKDNLIKKTKSQSFGISHFEYLAVAEIEKDITEKERQELANELNKNNDLLDDYKKLKKAKIATNSSIKYSKKSELIRKVLPAYFKPVSYSAAAAIALLFVLNQTFFNNNFSNETASRSISLIENNNSNIKTAELINESEINKNTKQEELKPHNQTNKKIVNELLAFEDNESQSDNKMYKEKSILIPELKYETLIFNNNKNDLALNIVNIAYKKTKEQKKENLWKYAETGVNVWRKVSSSDFEMNNKYKEDGSIEKLNLYASNFKISKTFNK